MNKEITAIIFWRGWRAGFILGVATGVLLMAYISAVWL